MSRTWSVSTPMTKSHLAVLSNLIGFYNAGDLVGIAEFTHVLRALNSFKQRPAVIRGSDIPKRNAVPS